MVRLVGVREQDEEDKTTINNYRTYEVWSDHALRVGKTFPKTKQKESVICSTGILRGEWYFLGPKKGTGWLEVDKDSGMHGK